MWLHIKLTIVKLQYKIALAKVHVHFKVNLIKLMFFLVVTKKQLHTFFHEKCNITLGLGLIVSLGVSLESLLYEFSVVLIIVSIYIYEILLNIHVRN